MNEMNHSFDVLPKQGLNIWSHVSYFKRRSSLQFDSIAFLASLLPISKNGPYSRGNSGMGVVLC